MGSKGYRLSLMIIAASVLTLILLAGCGTQKLTEDVFYGVWDYPEYDVRLRISDDNTWEMLDDTGAVLAGGNLVLNGDAAELYYTYGSPWGGDNGADMYNVLHFKNKKELTDGVGYPLYLSDQ